MFDYRLPASNPADPNAALATPDFVKSRQAMADALMQRGSDTSPIRSKWQGVARLAQALQGGLESQRAANLEDMGQKRAATDWTEALKTSGQPSAPMNIAPQSAPMAGNPGAAIAGIESGGKYDALGPVTKTGDRAYGKYQVMGANVGPWTKQYLGREMTPQAFAADPEAQDAVFKGEFGRLSAKHGPEGAARAWFAGEGGMNDMGRKDQLGTTVAQYGQKFASLGGAGTPDSAPQAQPPQQAAQAAQPVQVAQNGGQPAMPRAPQYDMAKLAAVLSNPYATPAQQQMAAHLMQAQAKQQMEEPQLKMIKDIAGVDVPHLYDPRTQKLTKITPEGSAATDLKPDASNEEILATADKQYPGVANRVEQLYRGEGAMPNGRTNKIDAVAMNLIQKVHPDWDMSVWKRKADTEADFSSKGKSGIAIQNLAKIANHSKDLVGGMAALKNGQYPALNWVGNTIDQIKGKEAPTNFHINVTAVADEMASLMRREGMSDASIESWKKAFDRDASEEQQKGAMRTVARLIEDRMTPLAEEYTRNKGKSIDLWASHPESKKAFDEIKAWANSPVGAQAKDEAKPPQAKTVELSPTDKQALDWANSNPKDPRAAAIKQRLGQ